MCCLRYKQNFASHILSDTPGSSSSTRNGYVGALSRQQIVWAKDPGIGGTVACCCDRL